MDGLQPARRGERVGELAADIGDLRDRQERGNGEQGQQRQHRRIKPSLCSEQRADDGNREAAEPGRDLELCRFGGEIAEKGETDRVAIAHQRYEAGAATPGRLKGDEFRETLDGVADMRGEAAERLARARAETIDAPPSERRHQCGIEKERQQRQGDRPGGNGKRGKHHARNEDGHDGGGDGVCVKVFDGLDILGGETDEIAGAPAQEIGRRQRVELGEQRNAHIGEQPVRHVMRQSRLQAV